MTTIAFLGLGNMGAPMSANLVGAGHVVRGFDPAPTAASGAAAHGVAVFRSAPEAVAEADVVITMLPTGEVVRRCYTDVLAAARPATLFIDSSTISVTDAREVHALAESHGMLQLDAPVSGGVKGAAAATLAFMVGGDESTLRRARPVLEPMAGKIIHCGAAGAGQAAKVCNNMVLAVQQIAIAEAFVLAEKLGLSAQSLFDVITGATGNCWAVHTNCPVPGPVPTSPANNDFKPGFSTALMNKDLGLAMDAVARHRCDGPAGQPRRRHLRQIRRRPRRPGLQRGDPHVARASRRISAHFDTKLGAYASARPQRSPAHPSALGGVFRVRQPRQVGGKALRVPAQRLVAPLRWNVRQREVVLVGRASDTAADIQCQIGQLAQLDPGAHRHDVDDAVAHYGPHLP
ncbi:3-hydroxyisobutyrate dehydrogenase mmsB [Mycobacterium tuberculosis]|nr:3-hydroxyisobutyrate dehydrogenase mmsB [Mycobacterium tuberculosis]